MDLLTRQEADEYFRAQQTDQLPPGGVSTQLITDVSRRLAMYCGYTDWGGNAERTEYHDGGTRHLWLDYPRITAIDSVYDDTDHEWAASTLVDADEYWPTGSGITTDVRGLVFFENWDLITGVENVKITYTAGWDTGNVPDRLKQAAKVQLYYWATGQIPGRFRNLASAPVQDPTANAGRDPDILQEVKELCKPYKRRMRFA